MRIRIEGSDLPGRRGGAQGDALRLGNVHVGVQRKAEVVERVPADAEAAAWSFDVTSREVDGLLDVGGPWVHGRPGARFLYLSWGAVTGGEFAMFRWDDGGAADTELVELQVPFIVTGEAA